MDEEEKVVEIDPKGKYLILLPADTSSEEFDYLNKKIHAWLESNEPFLMISGPIKLVKVDDRESNG